MNQLTKDMVDIIRYGTESRRWEFKRPMTWSKSQKKKKNELTRAALALSNTPGGGFIVIGIYERKHRSNVEVLERRGLTPKQFSSFNSPDDIARFLNARSSQSVRFEIYGGEVQFEEKSKKFIVIQVLESKSFIPIICTQNFKTKDRHCKLTKDTLYIRSLSKPIESRRISTKEEWEEMILRLLRYKEEILHKDLMDICRRILPEEKAKPKKKVSKKAEKEYERLLRRDKL